MFAGGSGWGNPFPQEFGGGPTLVERHYNELVAAVGKGGTAVDKEDSLDAIWRQCKARANASLDAFSERAAIETFPGLATSLLPYYEEVLLIVPPVDSTLTERREVARRAWIREFRSDGPSLEAGLRDIDTRFTIVNQSIETTATTLEGRPFEPFSGTPSYGGNNHRSTQFPNFSDDMIVYVLFDLGAGAIPTQPERRLIVEAQTLLNDTLPSWVDFQIITANRFKLGVSRLDITGLG